MRRTSRSAEEAFRRCRRKYFYQYLYSGTGVTPPAVFLAPTLGTAVHEGMPLIVSSKGSKQEVDKAVAHALSNWTENTAAGFVDVLEPEWPRTREEGAALIEAFLRAWARVRLPHFLKEYKPLFAEEEMDIVLSPTVAFDSRSDLIVEDIFGNLWIIDWKTTSRSYDWAKKYRRETQTFTQPYVASKRLNRPVSGTIFEGFWKGNSSGSILIRGVRKADGSYSGVAADAKLAGAERFDVWKEKFPGLPDGMSPIDYWVNWLPEDIVRDQFLTPQAIPADNARASRWMDITCMHVEDVEAIVTHTDPEDILTHFYQSESDWNCIGCSFEPICWGSKDPARLLKEGSLAPRKDHHAKKVGDA